MVTGFTTDFQRGSRNSLLLALFRRRRRQRGLRRGLAGLAAGSTLGIGSGAFSLPAGAGIGCGNRETASGPRRISQPPPNCPIDL